MIKVIIVGTGNVSYHLQKAFSQTESVEVIHVLPSRSDLSSFLSKNNPDYSYIDEVDVFIIAVNDDAITDSEELIRLALKSMIRG